MLDTVRYVPRAVKDVLYPPKDYRRRMAEEEPCVRLRRARKKAGYDRPVDAAEAFGWSKDTYKSHENGTRGLSRAAAKRYGRAFKTSPGHLLTGEGTEDAPSPEEMRLLTIYRRLSAPDQERLSVIIEAFAPSPEPEELPQPAKRGRR